MNASYQPPVATYYHDGFEFWFETKENTPHILYCMQNYWPITAGIATIYLPGIYVLQFLMRSRQQFNLQFLLILWNVLQACFSALTFSRMLPELVFTVRTVGFWHSFWYFPPGDQGNVSLAWIWIFGVNKGFELIDTLFIVFRKRQLTVLHVFHHSGTFMVAGYFNLFPEIQAFVRWFAIVNMFVHALMYSYYACMSLRWRPPRFVSRCITIIQMTQLSLFVYVSQDGLRNRPIAFSKELQEQRILEWIFILFLLNLILFGNFFYQTYIVTQKKMSRKTE